MIIINLIVTLIIVNINMLIIYYLRNRNCNHILGYGFNKFPRKEDDFKDLYMQYKNGFVKFHYCPKCGKLLKHKKYFKKLRRIINENKYKNRE